MQLIESVYCLEWTCYLDSQQSSVRQLGLQLLVSSGVTVGRTLPSMFTEVFRILQFCN